MRPRELLDGETRGIGLAGLDHRAHEPVLRDDEWGVAELVGESAGLGIRVVIRDRDEPRAAGVEQLQRARVTDRRRETFDDRRE